MPLVKPTLINMTLEEEQRKRMQVLHVRETGLKDINNMEKEVASLTPMMGVDKPSHTKAWRVDKKSDGLGESSKERALILRFPSLEEKKDFLRKRPTLKQTAGGGETAAVLFGKSIGKDERVNWDDQNFKAAGVSRFCETQNLCVALFFVSHVHVEQLDLQIVLPLEDKDPGLPNLLSGSPTVHPARLISDTFGESSRLKDSKATAVTSHKGFEQNFSRPKSEVCRSDGNTPCKEDSEMVTSLTGPLSSCCSGLNRVQFDLICVKTEFEKEAEGSLKDGPVQRVLYNPDSSASSMEGDRDELDNVLLSERLWMLLQKHSEGKCTKKDDEGTPGSTVLGKRQLLRVGRSSLLTKRKWEVPIETALQEDAPGLLEKLQERGLLEDITVYGAVCDDDWENTDEHFKDLECIARKIWGGSSGLIKLPQVIRQHASGLGKGSVYCLSCLVSLIDQAKSLRQRNWPVDWGWCRELQAFIFVFDKHNRVVLERPEYGNATYFFELVQSLPVNWQVLRLIHVLNVTALGKTALLENRPLEVGYELTKDESKILEGFGWVAGTGLGSFLSFCDRVFHDVKEDDNLEWRQRIGKCLMDGYEKGRIMTPFLPLKFLKDSNTVKLEAAIEPACTVGSI
ncbi:hypothetical protein L7F22_049760 [Adiantum nelumboides]|nr:hypothetical protein [Adiantum nelumboides]